MPRRAIILLFLLSSSLLAVKPAAEPGHLPVDLNLMPLYVRRDFNPAWTTVNPAESKDKDSWKILPADPRGRSLHISDLALSEASKNRLRLSRQKAEFFTVIIPFRLSLRDLENVVPMGLYLGSIGENWAVYLNGTLLKSEIHLDAQGFISLPRTLRDEIVMFDKSCVNSASQQSGSTKFWPQIRKIAWPRCTHRDVRCIFHRPRQKTGRA